MLGAFDLSRHFASQPSAGASPDYEIVDGLPRVSGCIAWFACEMTQHVDISDHTLITAEVSSYDYRDAAPPVFFSSRYHLGPGAAGSVRSGVFFRQIVRKSNRGCAFSNAVA